MYEAYYGDMGDLRRMLAEMRICNDSPSLRPPCNLHAYTAATKRRPIYRARTNCNTHRGRREVG